MQNKPIHRFLAWIFLVLFVYNSMGSQLVIGYWKWHTQEKLKTLAKNFDSEYLTAITLNGAFDHSEEVFSDGHWYDVVSVQTEGSKTTCYCLPDFTEDLIQNTALTGVIDDLNNQYKDVLKLAKKAVAEKYLFENEIISLETGSLYKIFDFNLMREAIQIGYHKINIQPPENIC